MTIIYSKDACVQCDATYRTLHKYNIPYETRSAADLPDDLRARHLQAPVVIAPDGREWSGFNPDNLKTLRTN